MRNLRSVYAVLVLILPVALHGCAAERKCGIDGCPGDAKITANVQALINRHPELGPPNEIYVQTLDHVVYLTGEVSEGNMSSTAESVALKGPGVTRVENNIAVTH